MFNIFYPLSAKPLAMVGRIDKIYNNVFAELSHLYYTVNGYRPFPYPYLLVNVVISSKQMFSLLTFFNVFLFDYSHVSYSNLLLN